MKIVLQVILFFSGSSLLLLIVVLVQQVDPVQSDPALGTTQFSDTLEGRFFDHDSLMFLVGENKGLPQGFELAGQVAYSAYPQLRNVKIDMEFRDTGPPMQANFNLWTLFGPAKNRHYIIHVNNAINTPFDQILLRALPFDAQVGILAHELGHIAYYHRLTTLQIAKWGLMYLMDDEFRSVHEQSTDLMPVYQGLGSQIWQYAYYIRYDPSCSEGYTRYGEWLDQYYLTDKQLKEVIQEHPLYR